MSASLLGYSTGEIFEASCLENKCLAFPENYVSVNIFQVVHEEGELLKITRPRCSLVTLNGQTKHIVMLRHSSSRILNFFFPSLKERLNNSISEILHCTSVVS